MAAASMQQRLRLMLASAASSSCCSLSRQAAPARMQRARAASGTARVLPRQQQQHAATLAVHASGRSKRAMTLGVTLAAACAGFAPWSWQPAPAAASRRPAAAAIHTAAVAGAGSGSMATDDTGVVVVYVTAPSAEVGTSLARALVEAQLVACVNLLPGITSIYRWQGKVETDTEVLLVLKTRRALLEQLTAKVVELHPYDEPEVVALPVVGGSTGYLKWVADSVVPPL